MIKHYEKPNMKVVAIGGEDIIQTSGTLENGGQGGTIEGGGTTSGGGSGIFSLRDTTKSPDLFK